MRVGLYADNTLPLATEPLCDLLNSVCETVRFSPGSTPFRIADAAISFPSTYDALPAKLMDEVADLDLACLATAVPYENNYFFESTDSRVIVSFSGWNLLTSLPVTNGFVYCITSILTDELGIGSTHEQNTGCVNDFWWDKTGVDVGMRAAFLCEDCVAATPQDERVQLVAKDVQAMLDAVSRASRANRDVLSMDPVAQATGPDLFDVFLCHNSDDKPAVRAIGKTMRDAGVRTWLDEEQLPPGRPWQPELEKQIATVKAATVFVGASGLGPWQDVEMRGFLSEFLSRGSPVIPVLLPEVGSIPELPIFLKQMTWIDLREDYDGNLQKLVRGLRTNPTGEDARTR